MIGSAAIALVWAAIAVWQPPVAARSSTVESFLSALQRAVDHHDRQAVSTFFVYPATVMASGLRIPIIDARSLVQMYDLFFTPEMRCLIVQTGVLRQWTP